MRCLIDGLRESQATEVMMLARRPATAGRTRHVALAFELAARGPTCEGARTEVGLPVTELGSTPTATRTA